MVIWCVLNRVDAGYGSIRQVATAPGQFVGYRKGNPIDERLKETVLDVLRRWNGTGNEEGRTLPQDYLYFVGDNEHNYYSNRWHGNYSRMMPAESLYET